MTDLHSLDRIQIQSRSSSNAEGIICGINGPSVSCIKSRHVSETCKAPRSRTVPVFVALTYVTLSSLGIDSCELANHDVGTQVCLSCHDGRSAPDQRIFKQSAHYVASVQCEDCHGAGFLHVRAGGRNGIFMEALADRPFDEAYLLCGQCHSEETDAYLNSGHKALTAATCIDCHAVHRPNGALTQPKETNALCLQCHEFLGFETDDDVDFHTGPFHPVDPAGSSASRCTSCHLPPVMQLDPRGGILDHTLDTVPPMRSIDQANMGQFPVSPNSCAGVAGCHDPDFPDSGPPRDVNDIALLESLQPLYESIGDLPRKYVHEILARFE